MSYVYILLCVICTTIFVQFLRIAQKKGSHVMSAVAVNYITSAIATVIIWQVNISGADKSFAWPALILGVITGGIFCSHLPFVLGAYRMAGVGITSTVIRAGVVIPALIAWMVWDEDMTIMRWAALALVPLAMILLRKPDKTSRHLTLKSDFFLLGSLVIGSAIYTMHKYVNITFNPGQQEIYKTALFTTTAILSIGYILMRKISISGRDITIGIAMGLGNTGAMLFIMLGLKTTDAVVFFPTLGCLGICSNIFISRLCWKEKLLPLQIAGILLAISIVILTNL